MSDQRTADAIIHLVRRRNGQMSRTRLAKLLYLADIEARRYLGHPITCFDYKRDTFGPYDHEGFLLAQNELLDRNELFCDPTTRDDGTLAYRYSVGTIRALDGLTPGERKILNAVFVDYADCELDDLLKSVVYLSVPMQGVERGHGLDMDQLNNAGKDELIGLDVEIVARSEEDFMRGRAVSLDAMEEWIARQDPREHPASDPQAPGQSRA